MRVAATDLGRVDVQAVQAVRVLDDESAALVLQPGVVLGDRRLVEGDVVLARPADRVGAGPEEADLLRDVAPDDLEDGHGQARAAGGATGLVLGIVGGAPRAQHQRGMDDDRQGGYASI